MNCLILTLKKAELTQAKKNKKKAEDTQLGLFLSWWRSSGLTGCQSNLKDATYLELIIL